MRRLTTAGTTTVLACMAGTAHGCSWEVFPNTNIIWGQVTGPAGGKATGCESGNDHPCWAAAQACPMCVPTAPPHTFVELGKAATFNDCMKLGDQGWSEWPTSAGEKPAHDCVTVGWGDDAVTDGIPTYMNNMCYCTVSNYELTKAGTMPIGEHGPTQEGQMAARCHATLGWTIVITIGVVAGVYAGVGLVKSARDNGVAQVRMHDHPHYSRWVDFAGLVVDGVRATQARLHGKAGGGSLPATTHPTGGSYGSTTQHQADKTKDNPAVGDSDERSPLSASVPMAEAGEGSQ